MSEKLPTDSEGSTRKKNTVALCLLIPTEIIFIVLSMYLEFDNQDLAYGFIALQEFFYTGAMIILIVVGFGLLLGYSRKLLWSSVGFNLLIMSLCVQLYFLINVFWIKTQLQQYDRTFKTHEQNYLYLHGQPNYGNMNEALKCSLAIIVAFSSIIGRAGILEAYFLSVFGTIVYELSRQVFLKVTDHEVGTAKIFLYGGVLGTICSLLIHRSEKPIKDNRNFAPSTYSTITTLLGLMMVWVLFPLLSRQNMVSSVSETENSRVLNVALSLAASTMFGAGIAFTDFGFRGFIQCSLAGGVACLSSSAYISNPVYAITFGFAAAIAQSLMLWIFLRLRQTYGPIDAGNSFLFLVQGIFGLTFTAINKSIVVSYSNGLNYGWADKRSSPERAFAAGWIAAGMALVLGLFLGLFLSFCTVHDEEAHFNDFTYWKRSDEISDPVSAPEERSEPEFYIKEAVSWKQKHAYL